VRAFQNPSKKLSFAPLIACPTRTIEQDDAVLIRFVHLQVPFVGAAEVERGERFGVGDLVQHSVGQFRAIGLHKPNLPKLIVDVDRCWVTMPP
jgi:hypothetical protein